MGIDIKTVGKEWTYFHYYVEYGNIGCGVPSLGLQN